MASQENAEVVTVAVMGATGAGKSTFINLVSNSDLRIGFGLESCTSEVQVASPFMLDGRMVTLIDTPGFDDTVKTEAEILRLISDFLSATYEQGRKLSGVIFLHRITDHRMGGVARKNFRLFRKLCGDDTLKNVVIVTNMWGDVSLGVGESRERELAENELFFKPALDKGAHMVRHDNTVECAHRILREILGFPPQPLLIQVETVDQHKTLAETNAGLDIKEELERQADMHRKELDSLREEVEVMMSQKDAKHKEELEELTDALNSVRGQLEKVEEEGRKIQEERENDRLQHAEQVRNLIATMQEKEAVFRSLQADVKEHKTRIEQMEAALKVAEQKVVEQEENRKKAEEELKASSASHHDELEKMRKEFEQKLDATRKEVAAKARQMPAPQALASQHWQKVFEAQREKRGIFSKIGLAVEALFSSGL